MMKQKIIFASTNAGKVAELNYAFQQLSFEIISQKNLDMSEVEETASTFVENALIKARHASRISQLPAIADDSGLVVPALHGEPGIHSARFAGSPQNAKANIQKLLDLLANQSHRDAWFHCTLVFLRHENDPAPLIAEGRWYGSILLSERGSNGFGYDPIFLDPTTNCSAAELSVEEKNKLSHRGQAIRRLLEIMR